jgi:hypothetical protein
MQVIMQSIEKKCENHFNCAIVQSSFYAGVHNESVCDDAFLASHGIKMQPENISPLNHNHFLLN